MQHKRRTMWFVALDRAGGKTEVRVVLTYLVPTPLGLGCASAHPSLLCTHTFLAACRWLLTDSDDALWPPLWPVGCRHCSLLDKHGRVVTIVLLKRSCLC